MIFLLNVPFHFQNLCKLLERKETSKAYNICADFLAEALQVAIHQHPSAPQPPSPTRRTSPRSSPPTPVPCHFGEQISDEPDEQSTHL